MDVGHVRVHVAQRRVSVQVRVRLGGRLVMRVDVMRVVNVSVIVLHFLVCMRVLVLSSQEHDEAGRHDCHREELVRAEVLPERTVKTTLRP